MRNHLQAAQSTLSVSQLDAILVSSLPNITYLTGFSGFTMEDRDAYLLITPDQQYIFTHGIYTEAAMREIKDFALVPIARNNPITALLKPLIQKHMIKSLGFETFDLTVEEYFALTESINKNVFKPSRLINDLRVYKTPDEIEKIKNACKIGDRVFEKILHEIKPGVSEKVLANKIDNFIKDEHADNSFFTIVAAGGNAAHPHHVPTKKEIDKNNVVLFDFGVRLDSYCSDMTRTIFFGKAPEESKKIYQIVKDSQQKAIEYIETQLEKKQKVKASDADKAARDYISKFGYGATFMHSLGHGIGLQVHEKPNLSPASQEVLTNGMVFSIEPGIYLPDDMGVRIEDLFAIENNKLIQLTQSPKNLIEI